MNKSILIAGDVMLDRYYFGQIRPNSLPPILGINRSENCPGGAANVAINTANLGLQTTLVSALGQDSDGDLLKSLVKAAGVTGIFLQDTRIKTTVKVRFIEKQQALLRADFEEIIDPDLLTPMLNNFHQQLTHNKIVLFSDYNKGSLAYLSLMMEQAKNVAACILIDPKSNNYSLYKGATVLTPNMQEFQQIVGICADEQDFERRAFTLKNELELQALLIKRAEDGMSLFFEKRHIRIHTHVPYVTDTCGAGDTVIATMAAALSYGKSMEEAAFLAARAAEKVIIQFGTIPITLNELKEYV